MTLRHHIECDYCKRVIGAAERHVTLKSDAGDIEDFHYHGGGCWRDVKRLLQSAEK